VTAQLDANSIAWDNNGLDAEIFFICTVCAKSSVYRGQPKGRFADLDGDLGKSGRYIASDPVVAIPGAPKLLEDIPLRVRALFNQAALCRQIGLFDASGGMFRKTIDVASKLIYQTDSRLVGKVPANAARSRIEALKVQKVIDEDLWELADVALLDGNDAAHDEDPYTEAEAEALEDLTIDLLDRLFVKPARIARVKAKQVDAGVRKK
jgi:hypothetical protein